MRCLNEVTGRETDEATVGEGKKSWNRKFERKLGLLTVMGRRNDCGRWEGK